MGKLSNGVQKRKRDGKSILVIDFRFRDKDGREHAAGAMLTCKRGPAPRLKLDA
jgi:hypothetical protein